MADGGRRNAGGGMGARRIPAIVATMMMVGAATSAGSGSFSAFTVTSVSAAGVIEPDTRAMLDDDPCWPLDVEGNELARALESLRTQNARQLVWVMKNAAPRRERLTLHLAIAHAETHGRILAVSASGAAGLAQATPIAIMSESVEGPLYVTDDYIRGAEAYFMKKPLGDADTIASFLLGGGRRERAAELLSAAWNLRQEGFEELAVLEPLADPAFAARRIRAEDENAATLERLGELIERGATKAEIKRFRDQTRSRYRALRDVQRQAWRAYRDDLSSRRDALLRELYGVDATRVHEAAAYDAGELLATRLDVRFSPTLMAEFLSRHLDTKLGEAATLGVDDTEVESLAIGLYNSGLPNIRRIRSGLIGSLPETDAYMRKVPGVRDTLDATLAERAR